MTFVYTFLKKQKKTILKKEQPFTYAILGSFSQWSKRG